MIDHVALLPAYFAAGTALLAFITDLVVPGRRGPVITATVIGTLATGLAAVLAQRGGSRSTFCVGPGTCSYVWDQTAMVVGLTFAATTLIVVGLATPLLRQARDMPVGECCFLLASSMTGGVVLAGARDLITLIVAVETLTLPLYILVGLRRKVLASAEAAVTFFVVSVVSTAVSLLGAALLYGATGTVHFAAMPAALTAVHGEPLVFVAAVLLLAGLAFKVAAVPVHAWAPATYDGAPLPVAAYLSTASKLGGVLALVYVTAGPLRDWPALTATFFGIVAALTMTVGNLVALRQRRMVRLLAWSSIAQAGYILAPLAVTANLSVGVSAALAYAVFYVILELLAFGAVIGLRGCADGGELSDYAGAASRRPWLTAVFGLALAGLAGLPPGLAGLFAKVTVVRALLVGDTGWLAVVVAINAVIGLAYYVRAGMMLFAPRTAPPEAASAGTLGGFPWVPVGVGLAVAVAVIAAVVFGFAPQWVIGSVS
jgi:NADH-quinone oxidoreductase subunit N